jgi:hypothetical protein
MTMASLALALLLFVQEPATVTVSVMTKDGNTVTGTTEVTEITVETSLGKLPVAMKDITNIRWVENFWVVATGDGTSLKGKLSLESWKLKTKFGELTLKTSDISVLAIQGVRVPVPVPVPVPAPGPAVAPGPAAPIRGVAPKPAVPQPPAPGLKPAKSVPLASAITRSIRTADGKRLYLLNASDSKVIVVNLETFEKEKEIALAGGESSLSLAPSGNLLVAAGKRTVTTVSPKDGKMQKSFPIEGDIVDVCATDDQTVVASTNNGIVLVSLPKQAIVGKIFGGGGRVQLSKDGKRIYAGGGSFLLPDKAQGREELMASGFRGGVSTDFSMSPDGRFAVAPQGVVYRLGKSSVADMVEVARVEMHWSAAWAPGSKRLFALTSLGFVKEYDTETFEMTRSWALGYRMAEAFSDEGGTHLIGFGQPVPGGQTSETQRYANQQAITGDLFQFEIPK